MDGIARNHRIMLGVFVLALLLPGAAPQEPAAPVFVSGDVGRLAARVITARQVGPEHAFSVVEVRVETPGPEAVEPLAFELTVGEGKEARTLAVERVAVPHEQRAGRPATAGEPGTYPLFVACGEKEARKARVRVTRACWIGGWAVKGGVKCPVEIVRFQVEDAEYTPVLGRYLKCSTVDLRNRSPRTVDVVFRARFDEPKGVETLLVHRVGPGSEEHWVIDGLAFDAKGGGWGEPRLRKLEVVDWCEAYGEVPKAVVEERVVVTPEAGELVAPSGSRVGWLREVWNAGYRYPAGEVELRARFVVEHPGTDAMWRGVRKVKGTVVMSGFRAGRWRGYSIEFEAGVVPSALKADVAAVVEDRLRMWFDRDFAARGGVEEVFAGAVVEGSAEEVVVSAGAVRRVGVAGGRVKRLGLEGGGVREFEWVKVGGVWVVGKARIGREELVAEWVEVGKGWVLPKRVELKGVFEDWGPEVVGFGGWEVR